MPPFPLALAAPLSLLTLLGVDLPSSGSGPLPLSLDQAIERAERASPLVRRAVAESAQVGAREVGASLLLPSNPVVGAFAGRRREAGGGASERGLQHGLHVEQTVEIAGQRGTRREAVRRAVEAARLRADVARRETRARVRTFYLAGVLAERQVAAAHEREALFERLLSSVNERVKLGAASVIERHLAEAERGRGKRERLDAELALAGAHAQLRLLIGLPPAAPLRLTSVWPAPPASFPPLPALMEEARARRAELVALEADRSTLDAEIVQLRREAVPSPTFFFDYQRDLPGQTYVGGGIALPLPIFRRNQGELALVRAAQDRVAAERDILERDVQLDVEEALRLASNLRAQTQVLETETLPATEAAVTLVTDGWRAGKFDLFRVIQASREAWEARREHLRALGDLWQAVIALDRAVGRS